MSHNAAEQGIEIVGADEDETWQTTPEPSEHQEPAMTPEEVEKFLDEE